MIAHDLTLPERASGAGTGESSSLFYLSWSLCIASLPTLSVAPSATCKLFREPVAFGVQSARASQQDAAMATATAEVAAVADDEELAGHERLVGKRLYDEEDGIAAQITAIHTACSRGHKFEEIRATCVRLDANKEVPECAITATGRVSRVSRLTRCLTHVPRLTPHLCLVFFRLCFRLPTLTPAPPDTGQNMLQCVRQESRRRLWHQLNGPEYHISANRRADRGVCTA